MYIEFIKDHAVGLRKGQVAKVNEPFGKRMIEEKYAKESNEKEFEDFKNKNYSQEREAASAELEAKKPKKKGKKKESSAK